MPVSIGTLQCRTGRTGDPAVLDWGPISSGMQTASISLGLPECVLGASFRSALRQYWQRATNATRTRLAAQRRANKNISHDGESRQAASTHRTVTAVRAAAQSADLGYTFEHGIEILQDARGAQKRSYSQHHLQGDPARAPGSSSKGCAVLQNTA
jgi:hypothetical protein